MDRLEYIGKSLSQVTMYDIKSMYNQAKNVVLNVSEMEAKVREATNDDTWGASSTLMQEIAQGTFNFQNFNEIMPCIYARFMEKEARQWRQIYKALQLLEYLVKNGSERVVDDARSHIATIKMLRNFYYIDEKGKDQGINVRNRSRELVELLGDVDKIRSERRKAKTNKHKYTGTGSDGGMSFSSGGGRYGGFGSDIYSAGGGSSSNYSSRNEDYGGGDESYSSGGAFRDSNSRRNYDEYDAGDDDIAASRRSNSISSPTSAGGPRRSSTLPTSTSTPTAAAKAPEPAPVIDLIGMDDDFSAPVSAPPPAASTQPLAAASFDNDDDFGGFQVAPTAPAPAPAPVPAQANLFAATIVPVAPPPGFSSGSLIQPQKPQSPPLTQRQAPVQPNANLFGAFGGTTTTAASPPMGGGAGMGMGMGGMGMGMGGMGMGGMASNRTSVPSFNTAQPQQNTLFSSPLMTPTAVSSRSTPTTTTTMGGGIGFGAKPATTTTTTTSGAKSSGFDDLWQMGLGSSSSGSGRGSKSSTPAPTNTQAKSIKDLAQEKAQAGIWGSSNSAGGGFGVARPGMGTGMGSGSFATFGASSANKTNTNTNTTGAASSSGGFDDLLF